MSSLRSPAHGGGRCEGALPTPSTALPCCRADRRPVPRAQPRPELRAVRRQEARSVGRQREGESLSRGLVGGGEGEEGWDGEPAQAPEREGLDVVPEALGVRGELAVDGQALRLRQPEARGGWRAAAVEGSGGGASGGGARRLADPAPADRVAHHSRRDDDEEQHRKLDLTHGRAPLP